MTQPSGQFEDTLRCWLPEPQAPTTFCLQNVVFSFQGLVWGIMTMQQHIYKQFLKCTYNLHWLIIINTYSSTSHWSLVHYLCWNILPPPPIMSNKGCFCEYMSKHCQNCWDKSLMSSQFQVSNMLKRVLLNFLCLAKQFYSSYEGICYIFFKLTN